MLSQSGRAVARRREEGVIPQVQQPARLPAAVSAAAVVANVARNQPASDDPFLQALLATRPHPKPDLKALEEARAIQVQTQMKQYAFAEIAIFDDQLTKKQVLDGLRNQILGSAETMCVICHSIITGDVHGIARMPCCGSTLHVLCLLKNPNRDTCSFCRVVHNLS